jgi:hypothetical protein
MKYKLDAPRYWSNVPLQFVWIIHDAKQKFHAVGGLHIESFMLWRAKELVKESYECS